MRILFCSRWYPYPPDNGSKIRIFNLIKSLSSRHEVELLSFASEKISDDRLAEMSPYCRQVDVASYRPFQPNGLRALAGFLSRRPRSVVDTYSIDLQRLVDRAVREKAFDVVIASQIDMAPYVASLKGITKILEEVELTSLYEGFKKQHQFLKKLRNGLMWWKLYRYVAGLLKVFSGCTVVSENERKRVQQILPGYEPIGIVPNGVDVAYLRDDFGSPERDTLIYSGALTYGANFDAVNFFLRDIFPLIQAERPQVKLFITGKIDGVPVERLPSNGNVIFTGYLDDIRPAVAQSWVNIVPLRQGGGTRLKVLESLALRTPVVATSKGGEGLNLVPGRDLLIADEPIEFARAVLRLLENAAFREELSLNGRLAVKKYDWQLIGHMLNDFVEKVAAERAE